jgi:hypothetical protein
VTSADGNADNREEAPGVPTLPSAAPAPTPMPAITSATSPAPASLAATQARLPGEEAEGLPRADAGLCLLCLMMQMVAL